MTGVLGAFGLTGQTSAGQAALLATAEIDMFRGAIIGALVVGLAFLVGFAVLRRGALAYSAAFMVGTAAALEMFWLRFVPVPNMNIIVLLQSVFAASVIIFLSSSIRAARTNAALGGGMFAASLVFVGLGIINFLGRADFSVTILRILAGVGIFAFVLTAAQAIRGDSRARLMLPGTLVALGSAFIFATPIAEGVLGHGMFAMGILGVSLVALTDPLGGIIAGAGSTGHPFNNAPLADFAAEEASSAASSRNSLTLNDPAGFDRDSKKHLNSIEAGAGFMTGGKASMSAERLLSVLDFTGIGVWDWSDSGIYQSDSLCMMLGADCEANFTPEAMRAFICPTHLSAFEREVLGHGETDGGFDTIVPLHDGKAIRVRGARRIDTQGKLERVVAFFEIASEHEAVCPLPAPEENISQETITASKYDEQGNLTPATTAAAAALFAASQDEVNPEKQLAGQDAALVPDNSGIDFQPVMTFGTKEIVGYRVLLPEAGTKDYLAEPDMLLENISSFLIEQQEMARQSKKVRMSSDAYLALSASWDDLNRAGFLETIQTAIRSYGLPYGALVFELNGLERIRDNRGAKALFGQLRQTGARIAFADENADSSILSNLHRYDFDYIRLPESLVYTLLEEDSEAPQSAHTLMALGRDLGLPVVAGGIQNNDILAKLLTLGCTQGDGPFLAEKIKLPSHKIDHPLGHDTTNKAFASAPVTEPETFEAAEEIIQAENSFKDESAISLDDWGNSENSQAELSNTEPIPDSLPSIREAFVNSVPSFGVDAESNLSAGDEPQQETKLPKWRTWGRRMR